MLTESKNIMEGLRYITPLVEYYFHEDIFERCLKIRCNQTPYEVSLDYDHLFKELERIPWDISMREWIISRIIKPLATGVIIEDVTFEEVIYQLNSSNEQATNI